MSQLGTGWGALDVEDVSRGYVAYTTRSSLAAELYWLSMTSIYAERIRIKNLLSVLEVGNF